MRFTDRVDAGRKLAAALDGYRSANDVLVLGIPRGGVLVAAEVARSLGAPLDVVVVRKIGHPQDPEYGVGAVDPDGGFTRGEAAQVSEEYLAREAGVQRAEIARRLAAYRGDRPEPAFEGRTVIVVDDGVATGLTAAQALRYARGRGASRVVMAAPVMAPGAVPKLEAIADEVVTLDAPRGFMAVGNYYASFPQTSDAEVIEALRPTGG